MRRRRRAPRSWTPAPTASAVAPDTTGLHTEPGERGELLRAQGRKLWLLDMTPETLAASPTWQQQRAANARPTWECSGIDESWHGFASYADAQRVLAEGDAALAQRAQELASKIRDRLPHPQNITRRPVWAAEGDELDRDRVYAGQLDTAWRRTRRERQNAPAVVRLLSAWGASSAYGPEELVWSGVALLAATDALEAAGYRVEAVAVAVQDCNSGELNVLRCTVKQANETLRADRFASVAGHPASYRLFCLSALCTSPLTVRHGMGMPISVARVLPQLQAEGIEPADTLVLDRALSEQAAIDAVVSLVTRLQEQRATE